MHKSGLMSRRSLAKALAMAGGAAVLPELGEPVALAEAIDQASTWEAVHPGVWCARVGTPESYTPVSGRLTKVSTDAFAALPRVNKSPLVSIHGEVNSRGCVVRLPLRKQEKIYGLGLQLNSFEQRGKKKTLRVNADPRMDTGDSHAPVPFYVTSAGIGILVDTCRYATFYFGDARKKPEQTASSVSDANPDPNYTHNLQDDDEGLITIEVPRTRGVNVYLFAGPTMLNAVQRYNIFSGGGCEPPEWGLGFWYRGDARATQDSALAMATEFRQRSIPCDVFGLEPGWQTHAYSCTFTWDNRRFPAPEDFLRGLRVMNYEVNLWEHAFTHPASPLFAQLRPYSGDYGVWGGLVPDFASSDARQAFGDFHGKTLVDMGVSGFKLDECDNSDFTGGWSFPELSSFPSGIDGEQMHSVFGLRYQQTLLEQFTKRGLPTYGLVRSSGALAAPYPFVLYSDLYAHRDFIRGLANSGFSGLLWCPEVRDAVSVEDLIRRLQSVVFSPLAMVNGWYIKSPPWRQLNRRLNNEGQQMENWEAVEDRCREIIGWRMSLVPYLMAAFQRYVTDGTPPFRALALDAPDDPLVERVDDQYMVGDRMMAAPLFAGETTRKVVFPAGAGWHDFWTGKSIAGGSTISVDASTRDIPIYVRTGSIVPWAEVGLHTGSQESRRLHCRVYGDGSLAFQMRDQDGEMSLSWHAGQGKAEGNRTYTIQAWKEMG